MIALLCCSVVLALPVQTEAYSPDRHFAALKESYAKCEAALQSLAAKRTTKANAARTLGEALGSNRRWQSSLTFWIQQRGSSNEGSKTLRLVQATGSFDAYVASTILGLEGDAPSREFGKVLARRLGQFLGRKTL